MEVGKWKAGGRWGFWFKMWLTLPHYPWREKGTHIGSLTITVPNCCGFRECLCHLFCWELRIQDCPAWEMLSNVQWLKWLHLSFLVPLLCLYSWIHLDEETIPCICKNSIKSTRGRKAVMYQMLVKARGGPLIWVPPTFLSSWGKPT